MNYLKYLFLFVTSLLLVVVAGCVYIFMCQERIFKWIFSFNHCQAIKKLLFQLKSIDDNTTKKFRNFLAHFYSSHSTKIEKINNSNQNVIPSVSSIENNFHRRSSTQHSFLFLQFVVWKLKDIHYSVSHLNGWTAK